MAIANFIPEMWSANLLVALRDQLVYGQAGVINRNYEGDVSRAGDTVHITSFTDPSVSAYTKGGTLTWEALTDATKTLSIDQSYSFSFSVDDLDTRQALSGFIAETTRGASYNLSAKADTYLSGLMQDNAGGSLTAVTSMTSDGAYDALVDLRTSLAKANCPASGRFAIVPPEMYALLLHNDKFVRYDASGTTEGLRNGVVGRAAGFDVVESNTVPTTTATPAVSTVIAGHAMATTFAQQIASVESVRLQDSFGDGVKGLHLYGGLVVRPDLLATVDVSF